MIDTLLAITVSLITVIFVPAESYILVRDNADVDINATIYDRVFIICETPNPNSGTYTIQSINQVSTVPVVRRWNVSPQPVTHSGCWASVEVIDNVLIFTDGFEQGLTNWAFVNTILFGDSFETGNTSKWGYLQ